LYINKLNFDRITKGEVFDKSQFGNKSCFRNEMISKGVFKWSPQFVLANDGIFEFDFVYLPPARGVSQSQ
jgi:hypothetical protein